MKIPRFLAVLYAGVFLSGVTLPAQTATFVLIDDFTIIKNGSTIFRDTFGNGLPPPDTGGNTQTYSVFGAPLGPESGGKLTLDADSGEIVTRPDVDLMRRQGARVKTNTNPLTPDRGLRSDDLFSVSGIFDLVLPPEVRERYGVRLTDSGSTRRGDNLGVSVMRTSDSQVQAVFHRHDNEAFTFTDLESIALETGHDQLVLTLSRLDTANSEITASFAYIDNGLQGASTSFATTSPIFNGEDFSRAQFMYLVPVVTAQDIVIDFGATGLWARMNDAVWLKLNNSSPQQVVTGDLDRTGEDDVVAVFSAGIFVKRNLGAWEQLHNFIPEAMAVGDLDGNGQDDVVIDFGAIGLWARMNDSSWLKLNNASPQRIVTGDVDGNGEDDVIAVFGSGIFVKRNLGGWLQLHNFVPEDMAVGDLDNTGQDDLIVDFGAIGLWARMNDSSWLKLHNSSPGLVASGDLDGNGADDVLATFAGLGFWQKLNLGGWSKLNNNAPDAVVSGDVDANGEEDIAASFGSSIGGVFVRRNQGAWIKLHNTAPDSMVMGSLDGQ